jgi:hypothetical protein
MSVVTTALVEIRSIEVQKLYISFMDFSREKINDVAKNFSLKISLEEISFLAYDEGFPQALNPTPRQKQSISSQKRNIS